MSGAPAAGVGVTNTLYGGVPPVTAKVKMRPPQLTAVTVLGAIASAGATGAAGRSSVPGTLVRVAVVCKPVESRIENTSGSTQLPLVMASKKPPLGLTVELTRVTTFGNVEVTR